jgi:hypothetical protein
VFEAKTPREVVDVTNCHVKNRPWAQNFLPAAEYGRGKSLGSGGEKKEKD